MKRISVFAVLAVLLLLFAGAASAAEDTIKIGMLAPLTGFAAADGYSVQQSVQIAAEKLNAEGGLLGKKVELVIYDDAADPKQAVPLAHKLIDQDKVVAFVGGSYSLPSRAVAPLFDDNEIPYVAAYAIHPDITAGDYTFRNGFLGTVEGKVAAYTATELLKAKKVALIVSDNDFGTTLADGFKTYLKKHPEIELVSHQTYPGSEKDFKPYLSKLKAVNPDVVFFSGYYFQTGPAMKQAREMNLDLTFIGEQGSDSPKMPEISAEAGEGFIILTNLNRDDPRPMVQDFLKTYRERTKIEPDMVGASAYDAFMLLADAIRRAGSTEGPAIQKALAGTKDFDGLTGTIHGFDQRGEVIKPIQLQIIKDGLFRYYGVVSDPELVTPPTAK